MEINLSDNLIQPSGNSQSETKPPRVCEFPQGEQLNAVTSIVNFYSDKLDCTIHTVLQNTKRMRSSQPGGFEQRLELQTNNNIDIPSANWSKKKHFSSFRTESSALLFELSRMSEQERAIDKD